MTKKDINVDQVIAYLSGSFSKATRHLGFKNHRGTTLYDFQVEFMYIIDEIRRGPKYFTPKLIASANEFIEEVSKYGG